MPKRWKNRPEGSNWGEFGPDDQYGRMNLVTPERRLKAFSEVREGKVFCLSLPLDYPGGSVLNAQRKPPAFHPVMRGDYVYFDVESSKVDPRFTDISCDEAVTLYSQYSTQWDAFGHKGSMFDADGDGKPEKVYYNGFKVVDEKTGKPLHGDVGAGALTVATMAECCMQGRGVMIDLRRHLGDDRKQVGYDALMRIMDADKVAVGEGDMVCLHTGLGARILEMKRDPDPSIRTLCAVLDGHDPKLLQWVTETGLVALICDNLAVEQSSSLGPDPRLGESGPSLPLHEHCLFKLGIHLGELWYLTELAEWLHAHNRSRFLLTAPPLRLPGAVGSPASPVATV
jgi:kynurenine formamidase